MAKHDVNKKQRLKNFDFSNEGSAMHLVADWQGGAANGYPTIVTKATNNLSYEDVVKAVDVTVELSMEEFLSKFMGMWCDDAAMLASVLGYEVKSEDERYEWKPFDKRLEEFNEKVTVLRKAFGGVEMSNEDMFHVIKLQSEIEKSLIDASTVEVETQEKQKIDKASNGIDTEENKMTTEKVAETEVKIEQEAVMKAAEVQEMISKAVAEATAELKKALDAEKDARKAEKEALLKSTISKNVDELNLSDESKEAMKDFLFKARGVEGVEIVVKALHESQAVVNKALETEVGADDHLSADFEDDTDALMKAFDAIVPAKQ